MEKQEVWTEAETKILVVDDDEAIRDSCCQTLERSGYRVEAAADGLEGLRRAFSGRYQLVILDLKMPGLSGIEFLRRFRAEGAGGDVIVITGYSSVESAVECMRVGATDYLPKPFDPATLRHVVGRCIEHRRLAAENAALRRQLHQAASPSELLIGRSPSIERLREIIEKVAQTDSTVLILGESGTGKELVARAIHHASRRYDKPFSTVDCGAIVETLFEAELFGHEKGAFTGAVSSRPGRFEIASGGTIFLDEIGNISPTIQAKLLRVIQEREVTRIGGHAFKVDVRIIAATNQDPHLAIREGRLREDLYYRLSVVQIEIPPLRARREDIPLLAQSLLKRFASRKGLPLKTISADALRTLMNYDWPGNVRELENRLERAVILASGDAIHSEDIRFAGTPWTSLGSMADGGEPMRLADLEEQHIRRILDMTGWKLGRAASTLGIDRKTLWRKIRGYGLR